MSIESAEWALRVSTDASRGLGHVKRSILIAKALNAPTLFIDPGKVPDCLSETTFELVQEEHRGSMDRLETQIEKGGFNAILVDSYDVVPRTRKAFVARMDDTGHLNGRADAIISSGQNHDRAPAQGPEHHIPVVSGPAYVPISPVFQSRPVRTAIARPNILICMGARDSKNLTELALSSVSRALPDHKVKLVLGANARHTGSVKAAAASCGAECLFGASTHQMNAMFQWADIAIGAGGLSLLERMLVGVANIVVVLANNQEGQTQYLAQKGAVLRAGQAGDVGLDDQISKLCSVLANDPKARISLATRAQELVDHKGAERIADFLSEVLAQWQEKRH